MKISRPLIDFVGKHQADDVALLRLKYSDKNIAGDFDLDFALLQIEARRKTKKKLPTFIDNPFFIFPSLISAEQSSNEAVARFHASQMPENSSILDLTAGLGVDDMTFAAAGCHVTACEIESFKCDALRHNADAMNVSANLNVVCDDSIDFLKRSDIRFDMIFADPARRADDGGRVHALADCQPDILANMNLIMEHTPRFLVKCSPLLDLSLIVNTVENLKRIYVVCFRGECKEVLIEIVKNASFIGVSAIDLDWNHVISEFDCKSSSEFSRRPLKFAERHSPAEYRYIYEPNAAVMKTGDWAALQARFPDLMKADPNTHLFLSDTLYGAFPGRRLEIKSLPDKRQLKALKGMKYNAVSRNHPLSAPLLSKKYGIISGGVNFLYAFRYNSTPVMVIATSIEDCIS